MDVKFSENLFISVEELNRLKNSLSENGWKRFAKNLVSQYGIAVNENNNNFIPIIKSGSESVITIQPGIAFDADMNAIILKNAVDIDLPESQLSGDDRYWLILRYASTHNEEGTVNISATGALTGNGTKFKEVLRGQPDFPTKVKLQSSVNTGEYEVVEVSSDTSAILAGSFSVENDKKYSVIGTFTPGFIPMSENQQIYEYDTCEIEVVMSADEPVINNGYDFIIAVVSYVDNEIRVNDYRTRYLLNKSYEAEEDLRVDAVNPLVSLVREDIANVSESGVILEFMLQHGFKLTNFTLTSTGSGYTLTIISGSNNYIDSGLAIPDHIFKGWWILNRNNMQRCEIADSNDKVLKITNLNSDAIIDAADVVIIPPFNEIEFEVLVSKGVSVPLEPYRCRCSLENINNRLTIPIKWVDGDINITFKYRLIGFGKNKYPFYNFNTADYIDHEGNVKACAGTIILNISDLKPAAEQRNYS